MEKMKKFTCGGRRHKRLMKKRAVYAAVLFGLALAFLAVRVYQIQTAADLAELQQAITPWKGLRGVTAP